MFLLFLLIFIKLQYLGSAEVKMSIAEMDVDTQRMMCGLVYLICYKTFDFSTIHISSSLD